MTTKQQRDSNGRFTGSKKKPENPDCEPATKGYVKCIARKFHKEQVVGNLKHQQEGHLIDCAGWLILSIFFGIMSFLTSSIYMIIGLFISLGFIADHFLDYQGAHDTIRCSRENTEFIQKYIPPEEIQRICEVFNKPKKECEE